MRLVRKLYCFYAVMLLMVLIVAVCNPMAFKKFNSIVEQTPEKNIMLSGKALDVKTFLASIPYSKNMQMIYAVDPAVKYAHTIAGGKGNCSNLVFGAAYYLDKCGIDYQIIYFLPPEKFLRGEGHVVLRTRYLLDGKEHVGIVDVLEGGIPCSGGKFLDVADVSKGAVSDFSIMSLNAEKDNESSYYGSFLDNTSIGWTSADEVNRYFRFIERIYVPLTNYKVEKYAYDGLALIAGFLPKIRVTCAADLFGKYKLERIFFIFSAWILRMAVFLIPLVIFYEVKR